MRIAAALIAAGLTFAGLMVAYLVGVFVGVSRNYTAKLRDHGINRRTVGMYHEAARLLYRLDGTADLAGIAAGDVLSPETREQVAAWVAKHRKEINT